MTAEDSEVRVGRVHVQHNLKVAKAVLHNILRERSSDEYAEWTHGRILYALLSRQRS